MKKTIAYCLYTLIVFLIVYEGCYKYSRWNKSGSEAVISWDVSGYYFYLPAFLIYKDPAHLAFGDSIIKKYHPGSDVLDQAMLAPNGNYIMKYSCGMAFLYLPWFMIAHNIAPLLDYDADGFSFPYQLFIAVGCMFYALIGLFILRWTLRKYYEELPVALSLFSIAACSNFLCYASTEAPNTHVPIFMFYALIIFFTYKWYEKPSLASAVMVGFFIGWAALCRPIDILSFLIPVFWKLDLRKDFPERIKFWRTHYKYILAAVFITAMVGSVQLIYWKIYAGHFIYYSYGNETFQFLKPHIWNCLFSFRKGWWVYSPIMILIIPGFFFLYKQSKKLFWLPFIFFLVYAYFIFSWQTWWYGGGFGQRALIQSYSLLAFPMAVLFQKIFTSGFLSKLIILSFVTFCLWWNLVFMYQSHDSFPWECEYMTRAYFFKIFGRTHVPIEYTLFLDHSEEYTGSEKNLKLIYSNTFDNQYNNYEDSVHYYPAPYAVKCNQQEEFYPSFSWNKQDLDLIGKGWLRISAEFMSPVKEWTPWNMTSFIVSFHKKGKPIKQEFIRPERALSPGQWKELHFDVRLPKAPFDTVIITFQSNSNCNDLFMDNLKVLTAP